MASLSLRKKFVSSHSKSSSLPICRSLIELHGGSMSLTSEPDRGTTLTVRFPAERTIVQLEDAVA